MLEGILDYNPELLPEPCEEDFLYFGYYQTQTLNYQVKNRIRLVKFTVPQMIHMFKHIKKLVRTQCPDGPKDGVLFIRRSKKFGRAFDDHFVPSGVTQYYVDTAKSSILD